MIKQEREMYSKILVPVDGSEPSNLGLSEAIKMAVVLGSQLRLVHIVNEFVMDGTYGAGFYATDLIESLVKSGRTILDAAEATAHRKGVKTECVLLESIGGVAADLILAQAKEWQADLIVMGTHGRRGLARMAMGSDAEQVVRAASVPVLLVRGKLKARSETSKRAKAEASAA
jgi:nucleotide-binding universal stress UspA family protein